MLVFNVYFAEVYFYFSSQSDSSLFLLNYRLPIISATICFDDPIVKLLTECNYICNKCAQDWRLDDADQLQVIDVAVAKSLWLKLDIECNRRGVKKHIFSDLHIFSLSLQNRHVILTSKTS